MVAYRALRLAKVLTFGVINSLGSVGEDMKGVVALLLWHGAADVDLYYEADCLRRRNDAVR